MALKKRYKTDKEYKVRGLTVEAQEPGESDIDYYQKLASRANKRMTLIEKWSASDPRFENMTKYAYRSAMYDINHLAGNKSNIRFDEDVKRNEDGSLNKTDLHAKMNAIIHFLESPSSLKAGLKAVYARRAQTINQKFGYEVGPDGKRHRRKDWQNLTWEDMLNFYEQEISVNDTTYGSSTELRAVGAIKRIANDPDKIREATAGNIKLSNDEEINQAAHTLLKRGFDASMLKSKNK